MIARTLTSLPDGACRLGSFDPFQLLLAHERLCSLFGCASTCAFACSYSSGVRMRVTFASTVQVWPLEIFWSFT